MTVAPEDAMRMPKPQPRREQAADVQRLLPDLLDAVARGEERIIIERDGEPVAALISMPDLEWFEHMVKEWEKPFSALEASWAAFKDVPEEEVEREVARALAEARAQMRREREERESA